MDRLDDPSGGRSATPPLGPSRRLEVAISIPRLLEFAGDETVRAAAIRALAAMPDSRALPWYLNALDHHDPGGGNTGRREGINGSSRLGWCRARIPGQFGTVHRPGGYRRRAYPGGGSGP